MQMAWPLIGFIVPAAGHGGMIVPPPREATVDLWFNEGCQIGCEKCKGHVSSAAIINPFVFCLNHHGAVTTIGDDLVTYPRSKPAGAFKWNPWFAPGSAPVYSPCGIAAGQGQGSYPQNGDVPPPGFDPGFDARDIIEAPITEWQVGSLQEVWWRIAANHGGGYAVRLCPLTQDLTEECFQSNHLSFEGGSSWIQFGSDPGNRTEIIANRTTIGTTPAGSQWTKVPIPSCGGASGGGLGCDAGCLVSQFDSPIPGLWGNGPSNGCAGCDPSCGANTTCNELHCGQIMDFQVVDKVRVPVLPLGDYALSFRWDCEQTPQIWSQCSNIRITSASLV